MLVEVLAAVPGFFFLDLGIILQSQVPQQLDGTQYGMSKP